MDTPLLTATAASVLECRPVRRALDGLGRLEALDTVAGPLRDAIRAVPLGGARDVLRGTWLGHPLHPALVQVPIGSWTSAAVLDLVPGERRAATGLIALGLLGAGPSAVAGWVDWAEQPPEQQRAGLVHALCNTTAVALYSASLLARLRGGRLRGRLLGWAGLSAATVGGVIGGHLAYRLGVGVNRTEDLPLLVEDGWHWLGTTADLPVGRPVRRELGDVPLVVVREPEGRVRVLAGRCSHLSGPLTEGTLHDGCLTCPWHGSTFRLSDGEVMSGPATSPQPVFDTRTVDGRVQVRLPDA
ncbi:Rieske 2Fe-2S domain-containing protein [Streptacidiphilus jiangxiensis]|uniref:Ferredoxin subunit of nitrite reductase or a ring-hydroxylating dioxygenase n=1 Tax=Streptacidiphilus jiangxiensis TaxID=235985 RepID=A0A1H7MYS9_STRJI|nr:Rieske 2Fe-2S domain-containing protein [Streptacidiphilus jiangxiensis]SEL16420.1 Ferredoxin subunit of nitrite reductase or a ring-hydroxylating dioxygenase [Streptacidiphilus jiangxiensis]